MAPHFAGRVPVEGQPEAVILMGPICCGKTTLRNGSSYFNHVSLDAAEIWLKLSGSPEPRFPGSWEPLVHIIGAEVFRQAVEGKFNLVLEIIGADYPVLEAAVERFLSLRDRAITTCAVQVVLQQSLMAINERPVHLVAAQRLSYRPTITYVEAPEEECRKRHAARNDDNLSAYFTEGFHVAWVLGINPDPDKEGEVNRT